ncbi:antistasin-like isoform X3 [Lineus longissimus]|uniref:antistasin-like isoform X2 n=1 Tax=Lineus longissimus TaxID=88925 RepID=UPI00315CF087
MKVLILLALVVVAAHASSDQPKGCNGVMCMMFCEKGFSRDANGCLECKCNTNFDHCAKAPLCRMYCDNGFRRGLDGCFDCKCNANLDHCKNRVMCDMYCEKGFLKGMDGCDICKCA